MFIDAAENNNSWSKIVKKLYVLALCLFMTTTSHAETLNMPDDAAVELLYRFLANEPPDFDKLARESRVARQASEFQRTAIIEDEASRLRQEFLAMASVDEMIVRVGDRLGEFDSARGGFPLATFGPDRFVSFNRAARITFDNHREFSVWELPVSEAQAVLPRLDHGRSVVLELSLRPFGTDPARRDTIRTQVRSARLLTNNGTLLGEIRSEEAERQIMGTADARSAALPDDKLDVLGLQVGASRSDFFDWIEESEFSTQEPEYQSNLIGQAAQSNVRTVFDFTASSDGLKERGFLGGRMPTFRPLEIVGHQFDCDAKVDAERLCGQVTFSEDEDIKDQRITTIKLAQNTVGLTTDQVVARLVEKYGSYTDAFDSFVEAGEIFDTVRHRVRHYVWGNSVTPLKTSGGPVAFTGLDQNWQIEAVVFQPEMNRTVLMLQLVGSGNGQSSPADVRL